MFCGALLHRLHRLGLPLEEINIWTDGDAAAFVRSVAGGSETVPTVVVGSRTMINPGPRQVLDAVRAEMPTLLECCVPPGRRRRRRWWWQGG
jgi:hypothetical protein